MRNSIAYLWVILIGVCIACNPTPSKTTSSGEPFPDEIIQFTPLANNPVFEGTGDNSWDSRIRERGYILKEDDGYHMWYTGYVPDSENTMMKLGYAFSVDGLQWDRHSDNPIYDDSWVEDMMVLKQGDTYYMFAEGEGDVAKMLTSKNRIDWESQGDLEIFQTSGEPISEGPYGTPTVWVENGIWYLFYERDDQGIWLATSTDLKTWTNVQDEPVITMGPESYDRYGLAVNQIIKYEGNYYAYYHATAQEDWRDWTMNVAVSEDLVHWEKYSKNPILKDNKSSGITVHDGEKFRFYTMHPEVVVHFPSE